MTITAAPEHNPAVLAARFARALVAEEAAVTQADVAARRAPLDPITPTSPGLAELGLLARVRRPAGAWRREANCSGVDPELFYPQRGGSKVLQAEQIRQAKAVCAGCTVRAQCLADALEHQENHGIWGGLSERERRRLQTKLPRVARCRRCGGRYVKLAPGQKFCGGACPGLAVRVRVRVAASVAS